MEAWAQVIEVLASARSDAEAAPSYVDITTSVQRLRCIGRDAPRELLQTWALLSCVERPAHGHRAAGVADWDAKVIGDAVGCAWCHRAQHKQRFDLSHPCATRKQACRTQPGATSAINSVPQHARASR